MTGPPALSVWSRAPSSRSAPNQLEVTQQTDTALHERGARHIGGPPVRASQIRFSHRAGRFDAGTETRMSVALLVASKSTTFSESTSTSAHRPSSDIYDEVITGSVTADTTKSTSIDAQVSAGFCVTQNATTGMIKLALAPG